jgi:hypothetical protein
MLRGTTLLRRSSFTVALSHTVTGEPGIVLRLEPLNVRLTSDFGDRHSREAFTTSPRSLVELARLILSVSGTLFLARF